MSEIKPELILVHVYMTDLLVGQEPDHHEAVQLWVAAVPRDEAVEAVRKKVPEAYRVELSEDIINFMLAERLGLKLGDVVELSSGR